MDEYLHEIDIQLARVEAAIKVARDEMDILQRRITETESTPGRALDYLVVEKPRVDITVNG